jgi:hypothetical protein
MANSVMRPDASLTEVLAERARGASDGRLVLDVVGGLLLALVFIFWRPKAWPLPVAVGLVFLSFGVWGITDREIAERLTSSVDRMVPVLRAGRAAAVVVGALALFVALFTVLSVALGTWVS